MSRARLRARPRSAAASVPHRHDGFGYVRRGPIPTGWRRGAPRCSFRLSSCTWPRPMSRGDGGAGDSGRVRCGAYAITRLPLLVQAISDHVSWQTLIPAVFGVSAAGFGADWQANIAAQYGTPRPKASSKRRARRSDPDGSYPRHIGCAHRRVAPIGPLPTCVLIQRRG
jgi:hypothetical protein